MGYEINLRVWRGDAAGGDFVNYTVPVEELIESRCRRGDFLVHICIQFWRTVGKRRPSRDDVHVAAWVSPGVAIAQPRRVDAHGGDMAAFANLFVCNRPGQLRDVTRDISVELFSKVENPISGAAGRNTFVQRQHFLEHGCGLPVWQISCPLCLEVFQLRSNASGQRFGQGMHYTLRRLRGLLASARPQPRTLHGYFAVDSAQHRRATVLVAQGCTAALTMGLA